MYLESDGVKRKYPQDVSYCDNTDCPYEDCARHWKKLRNFEGTAVVSISALAGVCRKYLYWVLEQCEEE